MKESRHANFGAIQGGSFRMFERSCLRQRRLITFVHHYASREVSCGMLTKVCKARINYFKHSCFSIIRSRCEAIFSQEVAKEGPLICGSTYYQTRQSYHVYRECHLTKLFE